LGKSSVAFIPRSRRPGFFGIVVFSRLDVGVSAGGGVAVPLPPDEGWAAVGWVASAVIAEVYDAAVPVRFDPLSPPEIRRHLVPSA
jgi:hypothetical protein